MSILQIEISDETRQKIEERAQREGRDAGSWLVEVAENALSASQEQEEVGRRYVEAELLKALESGLGQVTDDAWWKQLENDVMVALKQPETR